jgi:lysophospholipase L1-like esterase
MKTRVGQYKVEKFESFQTRRNHGPDWRIESLKKSLPFQVTLWVVLEFLCQSLTAGVPADQPVARTDRNSKAAHAQLLEKARKGGIDVYFEGDSIVRRWGATDYPQLLAHWNQSFHGWNAADFGWGADNLQNILWRLENGELDGVNPKVVVLLAGTNNVCHGTPTVCGDESAEDILKGYKAVLGVIQAKAPEAVIIVTGIFPRNDNMAVVPLIYRVDEKLSKLADGKRILYLDINDKLADKEGKLFEGMMGGDGIHPALKGYQVWADALKLILTQLLGPPKAEDHAPPPTGDPSRMQAFH